MCICWRKIGHSTQACLSPAWQRSQADLPVSGHHGPSERKFLSLKFDQQWSLRKSAPTEVEQARVLELIRTAKVGSEVVLSGTRLLLRLLKDPGSLSDRGIYAVSKVQITP
jgi:hypothetical protein